MSTSGEKGHENNHDYKTLRMLCLLGGIFSPVVTVAWMISSPFFTMSMAISLVCSTALFSVHFLSYKSGFIRRNAYVIICVITYLLNLFTVVTAYLWNFSFESALIMILVAFSIILVFKKTKHLLYYMTTTLILTVITLYLLKSPAIGREFFIVFMVILSIVAYCYVKMGIGAKEALKQSEKDHRSLIGISPQAIIIHQNEKIMYVNSMALKIFCIPMEGDIINRSFLDFIHPDCLQTIKELMQNASLKMDGEFTEQKMIRQDGMVIDAEINITCVQFRGKPALMSMIKDITERKTAESRLIEAEAKYRHLVENALAGVYLYMEGHLVYINPYVEKLLGYTKEELYKTDILGLFVPEDRSLVTSYLMKPENQLYQRVELRIATKSGNVLTIEISGSMYNTEKGHALIGTIVDITHIRKAEKQVRFMAYHDALTGLPNRYRFNDFLNQIIRLSSGVNRKIGLMFIDLDRFKNINDTMGHKFGDEVLREVSRKIMSCIRKTDIVSRYGGDEFIIVLGDSDSVLISKLAQRIIYEFSTPFYIDKQEIFISPSIGISFYPDDGTETDTLIKNADAAMYLAKEKGRNNYQFYSAGLNDSISRKMNLENGLRKALANHEFILFYQPQVKLKTGRISGMEALIRWKHPQLGMIPPAEFIPLAEETRLINPIGEWVLETACMQNKAWQKAGFPAVPVSVNVSMRQFQNGDFVEIVKGVLKKTGLDPSCLEIEITESIVQEIREMEQITRELRKLGISISIDDFGTGYSALNLLKNLNVNNLKIAPTFIRDMDFNSNTEILIKSIIDMGHNLSFNIIAEGIEDEKQMLMLKRNNCDLYQGYFFSRPLPAEECEKLWAKDSK